MEYYVYVILNPLKHGKFNYDKYCFDYEPFYVGKGKGRRKTNTLSEKKNCFKRQIINKIKSAGLMPIRIIVENNLNEYDAFELEKKIISLIGRRDLNIGTLTNFTDGGEGTSGIIQTDITKEKRKKSLVKYRSYFKTEEFKSTMSKIANEKKNDPEYIKYCETLSKKYTGEGNPMYGKHTSKKQKETVRQAHLEGKIKLSEDGRKKIIETNKKRKGTKNTVKRIDTKKYELISPDDNKFIIFGAVELQKFCRDNKLQFYVLKNNVGLITKNIVIGNKIFAKNTIGWKRN